MELEADFLTICGYNPEQVLSNSIFSHPLSKTKLIPFPTFDFQAAAMSKDERQSSLVSSDTFLAAVASAENKGLNPTRDEVEEMIFDAAAKGATSLSLDEMITCLEMLRIKEVLVRILPRFDRTSSASNTICTCV